MSAINKVPDEVLQTLILPCLSGKELALIVKKTNKQWKNLAESSDPLVARILQSKMEAEDRQAAYQVYRSIH
jgi:hypothetical protein